MERQLITVHGAVVKKLNKKEREAYKFKLPFFILLTFM